MKIGKSPIFGSGKFLVTLTDFSVATVFIPLARHFQGGLLLIRSSIARFYEMHRASRPGDSPLRIDRSSSSCRDCRSATPVGQCFGVDRGSPKRVGCVSFPVEAMIHDERPWHVLDAPGAQIIQRAVRPGLVVAPQPAICFFADLIKVLERV